MTAVTLPLLLVATLANTPSAPSATFVQASPVWLEGREEEMNVWAGFRAMVDWDGESPMTVRITASTLYRLFVNGAFVGHGPARSAHGFFRIDEWTNLSSLRPGSNVIAIEVAGYNANSFYVLDQPSFVQAEVSLNSTILAATGQDTFQGFPLPERLQKVQRYSFQRPFIEAYRLAPGYDAWREDPNAGPDRAALTVVKGGALLERGVPLPHFDVHPAQRHVSSGAFSQGRVRNAFRDRSLVNIGPELKGFPMDELELAVSDVLSATRTTANTPVNMPIDETTGFALQAGAFHILDLGVNLSGFLQLQVKCETPSRLIVTYDETLTDDDVNWRRLSCVNAVMIDLEPGDYRIEGFEPHTMRYIKLMALKGECALSGVALRLYEHPLAGRAVFASDNEALNRIFEAGRTTFAQNAVDIYMDCPHRERAGWLCDSFFIARAEMMLCGDNSVERNFIENYLLPESFACLPEGMLPMCYPADHYDGVFIPNWSLWLVLQLDEYVQRMGTSRAVAAFRPRIEALFEYFTKFENEDGLLENLESWVFIEWSQANRFTQDVNYPSNMLYAAALDVAGRLFDEQAWSEKAERLRGVIREQSKCDMFYVDNALRRDGVLELSDNKSEVCQYFAFYFGVATPETDPALWRVLLEDFGPHRRERGLYPEVHPANAFVGNMIRFELLSRAGRAEQIVRETREYLMYMVERTGTLWENMEDHASLNHGFASHICVTLFRDVLGACHIDPATRTVHIRLTDVELPWCRGDIPVSDGFLRLQWQRDDDGVRLFYAPPPGYAVTVENLTTLQLFSSDTPLFE